MNIQIGPKVVEIATRKGKTLKELAKAINTGERNIYRVLEKDDLPASTIWQLSEALDFNLFDLFSPKISGTSDGIAVSELQAKYQNEKTLKVNLQIEYPLSLSSELGSFVMQVHGLATKMGFKVV